MLCKQSFENYLVYLVLGDQNSAVNIQADWGHTDTNTGYFTTNIPCNNQTHRIKMIWDICMDLQSTSFNNLHIMC